MSKKKFLIPIAVAITLLNSDIMMSVTESSVKVVNKDLLMESQGNQDLLMYAAHRSHASHGSHGSHSSHRSGY